MKTGIELIAAERERQINVEGWTAEGDDMHDKHALPQAALCYAMLPSDREYAVNGSLSMLQWFWPFDLKWWKPSPEDRIRELTKAGALIAAEIDRLLRKEAGK